MVDALWFAIIIFALAAYVVLDGYDIGVGILSLFDNERGNRGEYAELVDTAWDGNESWLILVGVALWAGFPSAYATVLPALYIPVITMLVAIIVRGAAIEFQSSSDSYRPGWAAAFGGASLLIAVTQGLAAGGLLSGVTGARGTFAGASWDWLTPFSIACAAGAVLLYILAGAAWVQDKTEGSAYQRAGRIGRPVLAAAVAMSVALMLWLPRADPQRLNFHDPARLIVCGGLALLALAGAGAAWTGFTRSPDWRPFVGVAVAEAAGIAAVAVAISSVIVPPALTLQGAASPSNSVVFLLIGVGGCIPIVLVYNGYAWWVFRGKQHRARVNPAVPGGGSTPDRAAAGPGSPDTSPVPVRLLRRALLTVAGVAGALMCQNVLGHIGTWIDPTGISLLCLIGLAAWIRSARHGIAGGEDAPAAEPAGGPASTT